MISTEEYKTIISDLMDELPEEFFTELTGGVIMPKALVIPDYARDNDLYTPGQYQVCYGLRQIVMIKGSFDRLYPQAEVTQARCIMAAVHALDDCRILYYDNRGDYHVGILCGWLCRTGAERHIEMCL